MYPGFLKQSNLLHERGPLTVIRTKRSLTSGTWLHGKFLFHHCGVKSNFLGFRISLTFGTWLHRKFLFHHCGANSNFPRTVESEQKTKIKYKFIFVHYGINWFHTLRISVFLIFLINVCQGFKTNIFHVFKVNVFLIFSTNVFTVSR